MSSRRAPAWATVVAALVVGVAGAGCAGGGAADASAAPADAWSPSLDGEITSLQITPRGATIEAGATQRYQGVVWLTTGASRPLVPSEVRWSVRGPAATVVAPGVVRGDWLGDTTVSARVGVVSADAYLTVLGDPLPTPPHVLDQIQISPGGFQRVVPGGRVGFSALGHFADGITSDVTAMVAWTSSDPSVVTIDATGTARAAPSECGGGQSTIRASQGDVLSNSALLEVVPTHVVSLGVEPTSGALTVGSTQTVALSAIGNYTDGSRRPLGNGVTWTSSDPDVATVGNAALDAGVVRAGTRTGTAQITASYCGRVARPIPITVGP